jgi:hypothetical protein
VPGIFTHILISPISLGIHHVPIIRNAHLLCNKNIKK